eukprot:3847766-Prymnesium_polylepis.1
MLCTGFNGQQSATCGTRHTQQEMHLWPQHTEIRYVHAFSRHMTQRLLSSDSSCPAATSGA